MMPSGRSSLEAAVEGLQGELGAALVGRAAGENGAVGEGRVAELAAELEFLLGEAVEVVVAGELDRSASAG